MEEKVYKCNCGKEFTLKDCKIATFYPSESEYTIFHCPDCDSVMIILK